MALLVQKFGGTSVATIDRIKDVAGIISRSISNGHNVVAVVSAMAGVTNQCVNSVQAMNAQEDDVEYDSVVSSGELVTAGLLALALKNLGVNAKSYAAWQVPIITDENHGQATIEYVDPSLLHEDITHGIVPVICGFQGVSRNNRITTLGRGGSDLTAVAISSAISADLCEIYSDVDGVYTVDPNLYHDAVLIPEINYLEMLEMASQGAKVLQEKSVDYAMKNSVLVRVASSFIDGSGTIISDNAPHKIYRGLAVATDLIQLKVRLTHLIQHKKIIEELANNFIHAEIFTKSDPLQIKILVEKPKLLMAISTLTKIEFVSNVKQAIARDHCARISVIGELFTHNIENKLRAVLNANNIRVYDSSLFDNRINLIVSSEFALESIAILHKYCALENV